jgi:hypothetical protein
VYRSHDGVAVVVVKINSEVAEIMGWQKRVRNFKIVGGCEEKELQNMGDGQLGVIVTKKNAEELQNRGWRIGAIDEKECRRTSKSWATDRGDGYKKECRRTSNYGRG